MGPLGMVVSFAASPVHKPLTYKQTGYRLKEMRY
jgi:hypothetical protein